MVLRTARGQLGAEAYRLGYVTRKHHGPHHVTLRRFSRLYLVEVYVAGLGDDAKSFRALTAARKAFRGAWAAIRQNPETAVLPLCEAPK